MPTARCGESWSQVRARAGGGCGREDQCNHGSQHHPLRRSLSPAPVITAGRKERRPLGSDALAPGSLLLPLRPHWGQLPLLPSPYKRQEVFPPPTPAALGTCPTLACPSSLPETPKAHNRGPDRPFQLGLVCHRSLPAPDPEQMLLKEWWVNAQT